MNIEFGCGEAPTKVGYKTCDISSINTMITELNPSDLLLKAFKNHDIKII